MTDAWSLENIPITAWSVKTEPNPVTGEIKQITRIAERIEERIVRTQSEQMRNALIDLGWSPPADTEIPRPLLPAEHIMLADEQSKHIRVRGKLLCELCRSDLMVMAVEYCMKVAGDADSED